MITVEELIVQSLRHKLLLVNVKRTGQGQASSAQPLQGRTDGLGLLMLGAVSKQVQAAVGVQQQNIPTLHALPAATGVTTAPALPGLPSGTGAVRAYDHRSEIEDDEDAPGGVALLTVKKLGSLPAVLDTEQGLRLFSSPSLIPGGASEPLWTFTFDPEHGPNNIPTDVLDQKTGKELQLSSFDQVSELDLSDCDQFSIVHYQDKEDASNSKIFVIQNSEGAPGSTGGTNSVECGSLIGSEETSEESESSLPVSPMKAMDRFNQSAIRTPPPVEPDSGVWESSMISNGTSSPPLLTMTPGDDVIRPTAIDEPTMSYKRFKVIDDHSEDGGLIAVKDRDIVDVDLLLHVMDRERSPLTPSSPLPEIKEGCSTEELNHKSSVRIEELDSSVEVLEAETDDSAVDHQAYRPSYAPRLTHSSNSPIDALLDDGYIEKTLMQNDRTLEYITVSTHGLEPSERHQKALEHGVFEQQVLDDNLAMHRVEDGCCAIGPEDEVHHVVVSSLDKAEKPADLQQRPCETDEISIAPTTFEPTHTATENISPPVTSQRDETKDKSNESYCLSNGSPKTGGGQPAQVNTGARLSSQHVASEPDEACNNPPGDSPTSTLALSPEPSPGPASDVTESHKRATFVVGSSHETTPEAEFYSVSDISDPNVKRENSLEKAVEEQFVEEEKLQATVVSRTNESHYKPMEVPFMTSSHKEAQKEESFMDKVKDSKENIVKNIRAVVNNKVDDIKSSVMSKVKTRQERPEAKLSEEAPVTSQQYYDDRSHEVEKLLVDRNTNKFVHDSVTLAADRIRSLEQLDERIGDLVHSEPSDVTPDVSRDNEDMEKTAEEILSRVTAVPQESQIGGSGPMEAAAAFTEKDSAVRYVPVQKGKRRKGRNSRHSSRYSSRQSSRHSSRQHSPSNDTPLPATSSSGRRPVGLADLSDQRVILSNRSHDDSGSLDSFSLSDFSRGESTHQNVTNTMLHASIEAMEKEDSRPPSPSATLGLAAAMWAGSQDHALADWMAQLPAKLHNVSMTSLAIPGSHISLAIEKDMRTDMDFAKCNQDMAEFMRKMPNYAVFNNFRYLMKRIWKSWMPKQILGVQQQLEGGVRYLDIRVSKYKNSFLGEHGLYTRTLRKYLRDIQAFVELHPREIIFLHFSSLDLFERKDVRALMSTLFQLFGARLCSTSHVGSLSLAEMWRQRKQIVVLFTERDRIALRSHIFEGLAWSETALRQSAPKQQEVGDLISALDAEYATMCASSTRDVIHVMHAVVSPDLNMVFGDYKYKSMREMNMAEISRAICRWSRNKQQLNVLLADFIGLDDLPSIVVNLNQVKSAETVV